MQIVTYVVHMINDFAVWPVNVTNATSSRSGWSQCTNSHNCHCQYAFQYGVNVHLCCSQYTYDMGSIYLSPILRMIEAFETIVDTTFQDEDFNSLLVEESDMALLAERVSL